MMAIFGYYTFFVTFYSKDPESRWRDFQWGDRVLLGFILGFAVWIFLALPISVYVAIFFSVFRKQPPANLEGAFFLLFAVLIGFWRLELNKELCSGAGKESFLEIMRTSLIIFLLFSSPFISLFLSTTVLSWLSYPQYPLFEYWARTTLSFAAASAFILLGVYISYAVVSQNVSLTVPQMFKKVLRNWNEFSQIISHAKLRCAVRNWPLICMILSLVAVSATIYADKTYALFIPIYERGSAESEIHYLYLFRTPEDEHVFALRVKSTVWFKPAIFPSFNCLMIENPSNFSLKANEFSPRIYLGPHAGRVPRGVRFEPVSENGIVRFVRMNFTETLETSKWYNFTLFYYVEVKPNVLVHESISDIMELEDGTRQLRYSIVVSNNEARPVFSQRTFSTVNLISDLHIPESTNFTVVCYENGSLKDHFFYDEHENRFYPEIWIHPQEKTNFTYVFSWS